MRDEHFIKVADAILAALIPCSNSASRVYSEGVGVFDPGQGLRADSVEGIGGHHVECRGLN